MNRWYEISSAVISCDPTVKSLQERYPALKDFIMYDTVFAQNDSDAIEKGVVICVDDEAIYTLSEKLGYPIIIYPESETVYNYPRITIYDWWIE